jgi:hypothetical protein
MVDRLGPILVALAVMVGLWALLVVLAAQLPAGLVKDWPGSCRPVSPWPADCGPTPRALAGQGRNG